MSLTNEVAVDHRGELDSAFREIQQLAARLRTELGELDDAAIQAVSEATGAPEDYVRLAVRSAPTETKTTPIERVRSAFLAFDPAMRRYTMAGVLGAGFGLTQAIAGALRDGSGFMGSLALLATLGAVWNCAVAKDAKTAVASGALYGGAGFLLLTLFAFILRFVPGAAAGGMAPGLLLAFIGGGALVGLLAQTIFQQNRAKLGVKDPVAERQFLLEQLQDIQTKLRSDERLVTFLSVDIVGSTRMKAEADPLDVEFTFNEYHRFVATIAERHGGVLHSTAGDGVTCVFEEPVRGYAAGREILARLFEFNAARNKIGRQIEVRAGVHTGSALAPGQSAVNVNFAHVIDVSAHMQKAGEPGTLVVSESTARYVPGGMPGIGEDRLQVHDLEAAVWRPRSRVVLPTAGSL